MRYSFSRSLIRSWNIRSCVPFLAQRAKRVYTLFQLPYRAGRGRSCPTRSSAAPQNAVDEQPIARSRPTGIGLFAAGGFDLLPLHVREFVSLDHVSCIESLIRTQGITTLSAGILNVDWTCGEGRRINLGKERTGPMPINDFIGGVERRCDHCSADQDQRVADCSGDGSQSNMG